MIEVAPGVFRLGTETVNWYLVKDGDSLTAIDAGLPGYRRMLDPDLRVEAVVLTHSDSDHTGLASLFRERGARVLIHSADTAALAKPGPKSGDAAPKHLLRQMWRPGMLRFMGHMVRYGGGRPPRIDGPETFGDGDVLDVPGRPKVIHTPGHTAGHSSILLGERGVLFAGDAVSTWNPVTGARAVGLMPPFTNEDNGTAVASLDAVGAADAGLLLPGHGDPWHGSMAVAAAQARESQSRRRS